MNLKQNTKFLWLYTAILFSFALILIIFAGLTQNNFQKEIEESDKTNQTMLEQIKVLKEENAKLSNELKTVSEKLEIVETENSELNVYKENSEKIFEAYQLLNKGRNESAVSMIQELDTELLTPMQLYLYKIIIQY